ncbi:Hypothetical protein R9X50_00406400 [Acrodontium crateriforme]|uniref:Uncharacterized protein n=1 Tax=Acrodontium crateriforme TaxID=150365 RepID=A0AAQ3RCE2_9PEZI|nr:Hypothetical protein R9X50_00406400 [Acrodontium crateriforme]
MISRAVQLAAELNASSPEELEKSEILQEAFRKYLERGNDTLHKLFSNWVRRPPTKPTKTGSGEDADIREYFMRKREESNGNGRKRKRTDDVNDLVKAVRWLQDGAKIKPHLFNDLWSRKRQLAQESNHTTRYRRLAAITTNVEEHFIVSEGARRFLLMYTHHEIDSLMPDADRMLTDNAGTESSLAAAIREFASLSQLPKKDVAKSRAEARPYMEIAKQFGLGAILMAGDQTRDLWRKASNEEIDWVRQYCETHSVEVIEAAKILHSTIVDIFPKGLSAYGADAAEFESSNTMLSRYFKRDCERNNGKNYAHKAMDTLAEAAREIETGCYSNSDVNSSWNHRADAAAPAAWQNNMYGICSNGHAAGPTPAVGSAVSQPELGWRGRETNIPGQTTGPVEELDSISDCHTLFPGTEDFDRDWYNLMRGYFPCQSSEPPVAPSLSIT